MGQGICVEVGDKFRELVLSILFYTGLEIELRLSGL